MTQTEPDSVAVQLTAITPVRVYSSGGEYFDTEIHLLAPLEVLQLAIEDFFHVKPEAQILLHNRQQIDPTKSLRENGCLMLKGDPFIKILFQIKRGPILNLVCQLTQTHEVFPIACNEQQSVWEVKTALCNEIERKRSLALQHSPNPVASSRSIPTPGRMRLLWRYIELNDKATLAYYRVPTNATLYVMNRRGGALESAPLPGSAPSLNIKKQRSSSSNAKSGRQQASSQSSPPVTTDVPAGLLHTTPAAGHYPISGTTGVQQNFTPEANNYRSVQPLPSTSSGAAGVGSSFQQAPALVSGTGATSRYPYVSLPSQPPQRFFSYAADGTYEPRYYGASGSPTAPAFLYSPHQRSSLSVIPSVPVLAPDGYGVNYQELSHAQEQNGVHSNHAASGVRATVPTVGYPLGLSYDNRPAQEYNYHYHTATSGGGNNGPMLSSVLPGSTQHVPMQNFSSLPSGPYSPRSSLISPRSSPQTELTASGSPYQPNIYQPRTHANPTTIPIPVPQVVHPTATVSPQQVGVPPLVGVPEAPQQSGSSTTPATAALPLPQPHLTMPGVVPLSLPNMTKGDTAELVRYLQGKIAQIEAELGQLQKRQDDYEKNNTQAGNLPFSVGIPLPPPKASGSMLTVEHSTYTLQRINELEYSVSRLHGLLERATALMG